MTRLDAVPVTGASRATRARDSPSHFCICALGLALSVPVSALAQARAATTGRQARHS